MATLRVSTMAQQVAEHLRGELERGRWRDRMPGRDKLAVELGVNRKTVEAALVKLEEEGVLKAQGVGRRRRIELPKSWKASRGLQIGLLPHDAADRGNNYMVDLQHRLSVEGHQVTVASKSLIDLGMSVRRLGTAIKSADADAWIVCAGSSEVLEWFIGHKIPAFALFGRRRELMISGAGPDKPPAYAEATRELVRLGHRRIVLLCPPERRIPEPGASEREFLAELAAHRIPLSRFQLPDWDGGADSLRERLDSMFRFSPPSALIVDEAHHFAAVLQFLARRGLRVPEDVSVVCTDHADWFDSLRPTVAHIHWDSAPVARRIVQWARNLSHGKPDVRQVDTPAEFIPGGTIGPAKAAKPKRTT